MLNVSRPTLNWILKEYEENKKMKTIGYTGDKNGDFHGKFPVKDKSRI